MTIIDFVSHIEPKKAFGRGFTLLFSPAGPLRRRGLTEEELAVFDILTRPEPELTPKQETEVKAVAKKLLETLKKEKLVLDWRTRQATRAAVRQSIEIVLDELPVVYNERLYMEKCDRTYRHVYDSYYGGSQSVY